MDGVSQESASTDFTEKKRESDAIGDRAFWIGDRSESRFDATKRSRPGNIGTWDRLRQWGSIGDEGKERESDIDEIIRHYNYDALGSIND